MSEKLRFEPNLLRSDKKQAPLISNGVTGFIVGLTLAVVGSELYLTIPELLDSKSTQTNNSPRNTPIRPFIYGEIPVTINSNELPEDQELIDIAVRFNLVDESEAIISTIIRNLNTKYIRMLFENGKVVIYDNGDIFLGDYDGNRVNILGRLTTTTD